MPARPEAHANDAHAGLSDVPLALLVESVQDYAIFMLTPEGYIASWNRGAQRIKGYTAEEIIGQHFSKFYLPEDVARNHPAHELEIAARTGRYEEEGWRLRKDGTRFWANVVITAVRDHEGVLVGFGKVTRDLTEKKRQEDRDRQLRIEQAARAQAEAANAAKSAFLTNMSHELRTPLNAIIGYVDLLEFGVQGPVNDAQRESLNRVRRSSAHLLGLINDVLNIAKVEGGTIEYDLRSVRARELIDDVEPLVAPQFASHMVTLERSTCDPELRVRCDPDKTQQILLNLLTNAYKFTPAEGRVVVTCEAGEDQVFLSVCDNGRGIPKERLAAIFDPFVQIDRHLNRQSQQGVGLGLAISRDLARGMNGDLVVSSEVGAGSTFTIVLPRANSS